MIWFVTFIGGALLLQFPVDSLFAVKPGDQVDVLVGLIFLALLAAVIMFFVAGVFIPRKIVGPTMVQLHELNVPGRKGVFLGTRNVAGGPMYYYESFQADGSYLPGSLWMNGVRVFEEDRKDAVLEWTTNCCAWSKSWLIGIPNDDTTSFAFRIPKGSIQPGFTY